MSLMLVLCLGLGLIAVVCAMQYFPIRAGRFPRNPYIGLPGYARESDEVWKQAHEAAMPWIGRAGLLAAVGAAVGGFGLALGAGTEAWDPFSIACAISGAVAFGLYQFGANGAAHEATKRVTRRR